MNNNKLQNYFFLAILLISLGLTTWLLWPYLGIIVLTATLAIIFSPLYKKLLNLTKRENLSAFLSLLVVVIIVLTPLTLFSLQILKEAGELYHQIAKGPDNLLMTIQAEVQKIFPDFSMDFDAFLKQALSLLVNHLAAIFSSLGQILINLTLGLLTLFYFFRDGKKLEKALRDLSPLKEQYDNDILSQLKIAINSIVKGSLLSALLHGILIGLGFKIFGLSNAALWGTAIFFFTLIPGIGLPLILIPAGLFLLYAGNDLAAFGILIWGVIVNLVLDYLVTPQILKRNMNIHPLLILLSVLGGLTVFGPMGILIGPLILSLLIVLLKIYPEIALT
jgi:predicted PurR-regulated permease PerM